jgi:hypothetical protein
MNFALQYREFNKWNNTVFTDESTFLTGFPHQKNVWRQNGTRYEEQNIQLIENSGRLTVSVWGCMSRQGLGPLYRVHRNFDRFQYMDVMENLAFPVIQELQSDPVIVTSDIGNPGYKQHFSKASADSMGPLMLKCSLIGNPFISRTRL